MRRLTGCQIIVPFIGSATIHPVEMMRFKLWWDSKGAPRDVQMRVLEAVDHRDPRYQHPQELDPAVVAEELYYETAPLGVCRVDVDFGDLFATIRR